MFHISKNSKLLRSVILIVGLLFGTIYCNKSSGKVEGGVVSFTRGSVNLERGSEKISVNSGQAIQNGDILSTGENSTSIVEFPGKSVVIEIQSNSRFRFDGTGSSKEFFQEAGKSWLQSNKLLQGESLKLSSPTAVAGVRGTKFYTTVVGETTVTCHCQGQVDMESKKSHLHKVNEGDYLSAVRGDKIIFVTSEDLIKAGVEYSHDHSEIQNSELGKQGSMSPEKVKIVTALIEKKFAEKN
ncbi:hypothetical protein CH373_18105 [Leptospira perolatii]|uniref:FecR protein domain-containing protein n=1 Tax=Leptospira perolatii TaxID=2023191 RepID=A0A2M9ZIA9_9LEPT|nr:FecR domain-containing protein [Leptospira perolatii]PJZ68065.1 hypothetical protein CH360_18140 [Leptospira perolatii]PJZ71704.1 hypothetical protein CH373_18105 [Leptospira perolatii]